LELRENFAIDVSLDKEVRN